MGAWSLATADDHLRDPTTESLWHRLLVSEELLTRLQAANHARSLEHDRVRQVLLNTSHRLRAIVNRERGSRAELWAIIRTLEHALCIPREGEQTPTCCAVCRGGPDAARLEAAGGEDGTVS